MAAVADPTGKMDVLNALAQGGVQAANALKASQATNQATQAQGIQGALASAAGLGVNPEAQAQLQSIVSRPYAAADTRLGAVNAATQNYLGSLSGAESKFQDTQNNTVLPGLQQAYEAKLAASLAASSGGGGSGGTAPKEPKPVNWRTQILNDAGLTGTGLTGAKYTQAFLAKASNDAGFEPNAPRDIRARDWAVAQYGADPNLLDAVAPIGGFLKSGQAALDSAVNSKATYQQFQQYIQQQDKKSPGNQSKAVKYLLAQAASKLKSAQAKKK